MIVHDVELEAAALRRRLADALDRLGHGGGLLHGDRVRRHQPAGGVLRILEEVLDVLGVLLLHEVEQILGLLARQLLDDLRRVIGRHLVEDARDLDLVERLHQGEQCLFAELGENLAPALRRQQPEHGDLAVERQVTQDLRDISGVGRVQEFEKRSAVAAVEQLLDGLEPAAALIHAPIVRRQQAGSRQRRPAISASTRRQ